MNINELVVKEEKELSIKQREFLETHNNIISSGVVVANGLISLAQNLKKMRDEKLYVEAGFQSFEGYSESACGLRQRQAYNYIKILEDLGDEFLHLNAKIGVTKLTLLASLSVDDRVEVLDKVSVEDVSVSELKKQVDDLKQKNKILSDKMKDLKNQPEKVVEKIVRDEKSEEQIKSLKQKLLAESEKLKNALEHIKEVDSKASDEKKKNMINSDVELLEFRVRFDKLQSDLKDISSLLDKMSLEKRDNCKKAMKRLLEVVC